MPYRKTTQTPAAPENEKCLQSRPDFSQIFDSGSRSERKTPDPAGVDSGIRKEKHGVDSGIPDP